MGKIMSKLLERVEHDNLTGVCVAEDVRGNFHLLDWSNSINMHQMPRTYLQSDLKGHSWSSKTIYNRIPDSFHPGNFLVYTVPAGLKFYLSFMISAASQRGDKDSITIVGINVNGIQRVIVPFAKELAYKPYSPLVFSSGTVLELTCKPGTKDTDFAIVAGGHLLREE